MNTYETFRGKHVLAELQGISSELLNDEKKLMDVLKKSIHKGHANLIEMVSHTFTPCGVTLVALLKESHASIHTYPETNAAFVDVFTCGNCVPETICQSIATLLQAKKIKQSVIDRGIENVIDDKKNISIIEPISPGLNRVWDLQEIVCEQVTDYQTVTIGKTSQGISLFCNNERQSTELTQEIYHEGQFIPAVLMTKKCERVLIIGSSEGVVSQMAVQLGAKEVVHVDIDLQCVKACAQYLPYGYSTLEVDQALQCDGQIKLIIQDGYSYVQALLAQHKKFDVIVLDLPDESVEPSDQQNRLYGVEFLKNIADLLENQGAFITQAGCTAYWRNSTLGKSIQRMQQVFQTTVFFELEEQNWSWVVGCQFACDDPVKRMRNKLVELPLQPKFIDAVSISKATTIPVSIRKKISAL